jgi:hypothetical protein
MQDCLAQDPSARPDANELWQRIAALDVNNPDNNTPLTLYPDGFVPSCRSIEDCLRLAMSTVPPSALEALLHDMPRIHAKFMHADTQSVVRCHGLSEVEAKCIIVYTHECHGVPDHPHPSDALKPKRDYQVYFLYNAACRNRDAAAVERFQNFSFHFMSALQKLPPVVLGPGAKLYRGFGQRLDAMNDLYNKNNEVCWHQTSSVTSDRTVAYRQFANAAGTLMELTGVVHARDIHLLSMVPDECEFIILHNSTFKVRVALSCDDASSLDQEHEVLPDNVDLVILEYQRHHLLPRLMPPSLIPLGR